MGPADKTNAEMWQDFGVLATKMESDGVSGSVTVHFNRGTLETIEEKRFHKRKTN